MQTHCSHCQASMICGAQEKTCWCKALPVLPAASYVTNASCLCAVCLNAQLESSVVLFGIANCDTVKKARAWLTEHGVAHAFWDYKKHGVPADKLAHWLAALGWERVVNTRGTAWRALLEDTRASVRDAASAQSLLLNNASVIKRPIVAWGNTYGSTVTQGFDAVLWAEKIKIST